MDSDKKLKSLQMIYAAVMADAVGHFGKAEILDEVTADKRKAQLITGKSAAKSLGIGTPEEVFTVLADIFGCANWQVEAAEDGFAATASHCMLCAMAKRMNTYSPCNIYCLNPMEGMVKGLRPEAEYRVEETIWDGTRCRVKVKLNNN